jgi:hypothetical protein
MDTQLAGLGDGGCQPASFKTSAGIPAFILYIELLESQISSQAVDLQQRGIALTQGKRY